MSGVDVKEWLNINKLSYVEKVFLERNIAIEELMQFAEEELNEFAKDLGLDPLARRRFVKAITDTRDYFTVQQQNMPPSANSPSGDDGIAVAAAADPFDNMGAMGMFEEGVVAEGARPAIPKSIDNMNILSAGVAKDNKVHIIVTPAEQQSMTRLYERFDLASSAVQNIQEALLTLEGESRQAKDGIDQQFNGIMDALDKRKNEILLGRKSLEERKKTGLKTQFQGILDLQQRIDSSQKVFETMMADEEIDVHQRRLEIVRSANLILEDPTPLTMVTRPNIRLGYSNKSMIGFLKNLTIDDCDQPRPPLFLKVAKSNYDTALIEWEMDSSNTRKPVLEYKIEAMKLPKTEYVSDGKDEIVSEKKSKKKKKHKHKKKKKKHKKRKKKRGYDSSSSDSSDESSSESSSDSSDSSDSSSEDSSSDSDSSSDGGRSKRKRKRKHKKTSKKSKKSKERSRKKEDASAMAVVAMDPGLQQLVDPNALAERYALALKWEEWDTIKMTKSHSKKRRKHRRKHSDSSSDSDSDSNSDSDSDSGHKRGKNRIDFHSKTGKYRYTVANLKEESVYLVQVSARNESGWGIPSSPVRIQTPKVTIKSSILKGNEATHLIKWLSKEKEFKKRSGFKLLFKASKYQFSAYSFHQKCDNKGPTFTIISSTMGHVFGGYTAVPWTQGSGYRFDPKAWLFKLRDPAMKHKRRWKKESKNQKRMYGGLWKVPGKYTVTNQSNAVNHSNGYGPTFGGGHDIYIANACNTTTGSYSNGGYSYSAPKSNSFFAGTYNFMVKEYEVWGLVKTKKRR